MERTGAYLKEAYKYAARFSTDLNTQNGAILVDHTGYPVAWGANRFPRGIKETAERLERPAKYHHVVHAERASILDAGRHGVSTVGLTMYATWAACNECANAIIESGISRVIGHRKTLDNSPSHWKESIELAIEKFKEAGVFYDNWEGDIGGIQLRFNGAPFRP